MITNSYLLYIGYVLFCGFFVLALDVLRLIKYLLLMLTQEDRAERRSRRRQRFYIAKIYQCLMVICFIQSFVVGLLLIEKCKWSEIASQIAEHYETRRCPPWHPVSYNQDDFLNYAKTAFEFMMVNASAAILVVYFNKVFERLQREVVPLRTRMVMIAILIVLIILWIRVVNRLLNKCVDGEQQLIRVMFDKKSKPWWKIV